MVWIDARMNAAEMVNFKVPWNRTSDTFVDNAMR